MSNGWPQRTSSFWPDQAMAVALSLESVAGGHAAVAAELIESWETLWKQGAGSQAVLLAVPPGWGRTTALESLAVATEWHGAPVTLVVPIAGMALPPDTGLQARVVQDLLAGAHVRHRAAELLGVDRAGGVLQLGLGVGGLFVSGLAATTSFLLAGMAANAGSRLWDGSLAGQEGGLARAARAVAALSVEVPIVVIIDDADYLDHDLAVILIENLCARNNGQVLVAAAVNPGSSLAEALTADTRYFLFGRVHKADADPDMSYDARTALARELRPGLPAVAVSRIGQRTQTFSDVFAVTSAERLTDIDADDDQATVLAVIDAVIDARMPRGEPSLEAVAVAFAGGLVHARQAQRMLAVLGAATGGAENERNSDPGDDLLRWESLVRVADAVSPRLAEQVEVLSAGTRRALAAAVLDEAVSVAADPAAGLVDRVVALQAAHRVRTDLGGKRELLQTQREVVAGLEELGDIAAACRIAGEALAGVPPGDQTRYERDELSAAVLRLSHMVQERRYDPVIEQAIALAEAGGAAVSLEARAWATVYLLDIAGQRGRALQLAGQVAAELDGPVDLGRAGDRWRLLLAFHAGRAGYPAISQQVLAPLIGSTDTGRQDAAHAVLYAIGGPRADTRLQVVTLEAELQARPADDYDDLLRLHHALAADYETLGDYRKALSHGRQELELSRRILGADHPNVLTARGNIALWTGLSGNAAAALKLYEQLLADQERVLGHHHADTLNTRSEIAYWTGMSGNVAGALKLSTDVWADQERFLGSHHQNTLRTRHNIAFWTAQNGDQAAALALNRELLPDQQRALSPHHPYALKTRANIAVEIGKCGKPDEALRLLQELLPDLEQAQGPDHPDTLDNRHNIAFWAGECEGPARGLQLFRDLLPDRERVLGRDHPNTLAVRKNIAIYADQCGQRAEARRLYRKLLPDQQRVLGPDHADTRATRHFLAASRPSPAPSHGPPHRRRRR
jgi:tetratricopeptide (TPR) repeat protein